MSETQGLGRAEEKLGAALADKMLPDASDKSDGDEAAWLRKARAEIEAEDEAGRAQRELQAAGRKARAIELRVHELKLAAGLKGRAAVKARGQPAEPAAAKIAEPVADGVTTLFWAFCCLVAVLLAVGWLYGRQLHRLEARQAALGARAHADAEAWTALRLHVDALEQRWEAAASSLRAPAERRACDLLRRARDFEGDIYRRGPCSRDWREATQIYSEAVIANATTPGVVPVGFIGQRLLPWLGDMGDCRNRGQNAGDGAEHYRAERERLRC
jgi:hypothetical protein